MEPETHTWALWVYWPILPSIDYIKRLSNEAIAVLEAAAQLAHTSLLSN